LVATVCGLLDEWPPGSRHHPRRQLITYVKDRLGHDRRYAMDAGKIEKELGWVPEKTFKTGPGTVVRWYLSNERWMSETKHSGGYMCEVGQVRRRDWYRRHVA
jgi:dTDP-glucose 4,6-dehydratase